MTRKHFILIANIVKNIDSKDTRQQVALDFAQALTNENPNFDVVRFVKACGGDTSNRSEMVMF